ncbi:MAG: tRNA (N6-isopentenyl adenosine(37)-C2)-methylthiotransferase MiaB [Spirochaeta sp. LUC14_002_19_P3]|nr:MAG: tRNA (N6-isopentenyl adenosine(37)-C2)-methylthiotransferase MiaB [Spirochaeta sp. LUC14_002_19_P3]
MKYHIVPYGCQMNRSDTERVKTILNSMGYTESGDESADDVLIKGIAACSVRQKAIDRVYGKIHKWNKEKNEKPLITFITGCMLPADKANFLKMFDLVFPIEQLPQLPDMIRQYGVPIPALRELGVESMRFYSNSEAENSFIEDFWQLKPQYSSRIEAYVPIQNGCDKFCSFCAVPYTRGREVSRASGDILAEVEGLVNQNFKAITLLGQNVNSYGRDKPGRELSFAQLMREVGEIGRRSGKPFWTYFTSPHPRDISRELLEVMSSYPVLADWVHLPLQSGDDEVLRRMNRNHSMARYRGAVEDIRRILPRATLFTDIIAGFSGESEDQFEKTVQAMREFQFDMAYIAQYSPRPGARSARWEDDVSRQEKERRYRILSEALIQCAEPKRQAQVGTLVRVLLTGADRRSGYLSGYTEGRIPIRLKAGSAAIGEFIQVRISSVRPLSMEGEVPGGTEN